MGEGSVVYSQGKGWREERRAAQGLGRGGSEYRGQHVCEVVAQACVHRQSVACVLMLVGGP